MKRVVAAAAALALGAAAVVLSGVISVKASSGHLPPTAWLLDLTKRRSVAVRSLGIDTPPIDDAALVRLGAAHFDRGCRPCHGAPGEGAPAIPARMTPHPPALAAQVARWQPRELFYLVAHGVKFTGMPAWPAPARTDEAWAVVAFLRRLPELDGPAYRRLAGREPLPDAGPAACVACHDGRSPLVPRLRGQSTEYLGAALDAYAEGRRFSGIMQPIAAALAAEARRALAGALGSTTPETAPAVAGLLAIGDPDRNVPPCATCHLPGDGEGHAAYPRLAGQPAPYLRRQLELFVDGRRGGSRYAAIMTPIARRLTPAQRQTAAEAFARLGGVVR